MNTGQSKKVQFFILTEATFFLVILTIIKGTVPIILFCDRLFPPLGIISERFRKIHISLGLSNPLASSFDDCPWPPSFPIEKNFTHGILEPILNPLHENLLTELQAPWPILLWNARGPSCLFRKNQRSVAIYKLDRGYPRWRVVDCLRRS